MAKIGIEGEQTFKLGNGEFTLIELLQMLSSEVITKPEFRKAIGMEEGE